MTGPDQTAQPSGAPDDAGEAERDRIAARLRAGHPRFVVMWSPTSGQYVAVPKFRVRGCEKLSADSPEELAAQMTQLARAHPPRTRRRAGPDSED